MDRALSGKAALVTGGSRRLGRATCLALARAGANVVVHYMKSEVPALQLVRELEGLGVRGWAVSGDLRVESELGTVVERAVAVAGPLSILVNNASAFPGTTFDTITREDLLSSIEIDAWAPFELARQFARSAPDGGHIVNMLDTRIAAQYDWKHFGYCAAKHLLGLFTELMAVHLAPRIAVNGVAPGLILPPEGYGADYLEALKGELPMQRVGNPELVANAILFLVTSEFITGQTIFVDGGRHLLGGSRG
jgi:NAD(P)-dependent dehydrogenase (short-subunit alcohol dehydrogenase family)